MSIRHAANLYQHRANRLTSAPGAEPITATELRTHLRLTATEFPDAQADDVIEEARQFIEDQFGMAFITQSWQLNLDRWPDGRSPWWDGVREGAMGMLHNGNGAVEIPRWPFQSLTTVKTFDEDSTETAITIATTFDEDAQSIPGRVALKRGATWPTAMRAVNAIEVVYVAGYGDAATDVPAPLKRAVKHMAAYLYSHRGDGCAADEALVKSGAGAIMGQYKVKRL